MLCYRAGKFTNISAYKRDPNAETRFAFQWLPPPPTSNILPLPPPQVAIFQPHPLPGNNIFPLPNRKAATKSFLVDSPLRPLAPLGLVEWSKERLQIKKD